MNKNLFFLFVSIILLFSGCTKKNIVEIKPYTSKYNKESVNLNINFRAVNDKRKSKIIAKVIDNGKIIKTFKSDTNMESWFENSLNKDFSTARIDVLYSSKTKLEINILNIEATYTKGMILENNLVGNVEVELVFTKGRTTYKKYIKSSFSKWKMSISDASDFENFIQENMSDAIINSVISIIHMLNKSK